MRDALPKSDEPVLTLVLALDSFGLPLVAPPGVPAERLDILRTRVSGDVRRQGLPGRRDEDRPADRRAARAASKLAAMIDDLATAATPEMVAAYRRLGAAK